MPSSCKGTRKPLPLDDHIQTEENWCRQRNARLHQFPKQLGAVHKLITAVKLIIQKGNIPPQDIHTAYMNYISVEKCKPRYSLTAKVGTNQG